MPDNMNQFQIVDLAWMVEILLVSASWTLVCHGVRWPKASIFRTLIQSFLLMASIAAADLVLIGVFGIYVRIANTVIRGVLFALYMLFASRYRKKTNVIIWCSMYAGVCALSIIAGQLSFLTGEFLMRGYPEGVARCLVYLLMIPLALFLRHYNFDEYETLPGSGLMLIVAGDASILALHVVESIWAGRDYRINVILAGAYSCMLVMVLVTIHAMHSMCAEQSEILALQTERQRLLSEREHLKMTESNLEDLRCMRHDLKNQYAYMRILLQEKRYGELDSYFDQVSENLPPQLKFIDCGNRSMNTILNMEMSKAKNAHIAVTHQLVVPPVLPFGDDDLCAIIANLMDNAIEATVGTENPTVHLSIYPHKSYLFIMCRNATSLKKLERGRRGLRTTKGDEQLHGYGTKIVRKTAEKYNGCAEYYLEDGYFEAKVMLDMMEGTDHADQDRIV